MLDVFKVAHRAPLILAAARNKVPAVYPSSEFAREGGLLSYGGYLVDVLCRTATYVDRILRGAKPSELPVQYPSKFELVVNLKTARALGLTIPPNLLAIAGRGDPMRRREFIAGLGGACALGALKAWADILSVLRSTTSIG